MRLDNKKISKNLQENSSGKIFKKNLQEKTAGRIFRKNLEENLPEKSCDLILYQENFETKYKMSNLKFFAIKTYMV